MWLKQEFDNKNRNGISDALSKNFTIRTGTVFHEAKAEIDSKDRNNIPTRFRQLE